MHSACRYDGERLTHPTLSLSVEQTYADVPLNPRNTSLPLVGGNKPSAKKGSGAVAAAGEGPGRSAVHDSNFQQLHLLGAWGMLNAEANLLGD